MSSPAIEQCRNKPDDKDRSSDEIEEKFCDRFDGEIRHLRTHLNEPLKNNKELGHDRDRNIDGPKPSTIE